MANHDNDLVPLDIENPDLDPEEQAIKDAAQTDTVVRGVNGAAEPKARRLRPLAGIIIIAVVVLAALYMRHGMANRHTKSTAQTETSKIGVGPATNVEKGLLSDQARSGLDTGQTHVPGSSTPRPSILGANGSGAADIMTGSPGNGSSATSIPPLEYRPNPISTAADGSLSFAEQRRLAEYKRQMEAMEAPTAVKGNVPSETATSSATQSTDPLQAIQSALLNARAAQGLGTSGQAAAPPTGIAAQDQRTEYERQNDQQQKVGFGPQNSKQESDYLSRNRTAPLSQYEVKAGWLIPAVLEQQLNSDLPGLIRALVRENVYDTVSGRFCAHPCRQYPDRNLQFPHRLWTKCVASHLEKGYLSRWKLHFNRQLRGARERRRSGLPGPSRQSLGPYPLRRFAHFSVRRRYRVEPRHELLGLAITERGSGSGPGSWTRDRSVGSRSNAQELERPAYDSGEAWLPVLRACGEGHRL